MQYICIINRFYPGYSLSMSFNLHFPVPSKPFSQRTMQTFHHPPMSSSSVLSCGSYAYFVWLFCSNGVPSTSDQCYHWCTIYRIDEWHTLLFPMPLLPHHNPEIQQYLPSDKSRIIIWLQQSYCRRSRSGCGGL